ncbi:unnamed protein product [Pleuronectes platessa]|uniref:Uncharacterized protein n=1 Tax=Pleuronectes platessa TaxID=8262 RepID=A0A9N7Z0P3_PLEPL|nr:unnamed protein product [Pleuronectes platessa]
MTPPVHVHWPLLLELHCRSPAGYVQAAGPGTTGPAEDPSPRCPTTLIWTAAERHHGGRRKLQSVLGDTFEYENLCTDPIPRLFIWVDPSWTQSQDSLCFSDDWSSKEEMVSETVSGKETGLRASLWPPGSLHLAAEDMAPVVMFKVELCTETGGVAPGRKEQIRPFTLQPRSRVLLPHSWWAAARLSVRTVRGMAPAAAASELLLHLLKVLTAPPAHCSSCTSCSLHHLHTAPPAHCSSYTSCSLHHLFLLHLLLTAPPVHCVSCTSCTLFLLHLLLTAPPAPCSSCTSCSLHHLHPVPPAPPAGAHCSSCTHR